MPKTAKKTVDTAAADKAIADAARNLFAAIAMHAPALASTVSSVAPVEDEDADDVSDEDEAEDDEDEEKELPTLDREETEALGIKDLRALAKEYGISETKKADILAAFDEGNFFDEGEDEADEEDEDEDSDEEESEGYSREELEEEDLKSLRAIAKEAGFSASDYKGMDQDALIDLILGEDDEDEDEDDEDESDEDEADEDEEEVEELDEDALNAMSLTELKSLAKEIGVKVKVPASAKTDAKKKKVYVEAILETGDEE